MGWAIRDDCRSDRRVRLNGNDLLMSLQLLVLLGRKLRAKPLERVRVVMCGRQLLVPLMWIGIGLERDQVMSKPLRGRWKGARRDNHLSLRQGNGRIRRQISPSRNDIRGRLRLSGLGDSRNGRRSLGPRHSSYG
jgi:hypothetical protein